MKEVKALIIVGSVCWCIHIIRETTYQLDPIEKITTTSSEFVFNTQRQMPHLVPSHWAFCAKMTYRCWCDVITSHRRWHDVILRHVSAGLLANLLPKSNMKGKKKWLLVNFTKYRRQKRFPVLICNYDSTLTKTEIFIKLLVRER